MGRRNCSFPLGCWSGQCETGSKCFQALLVSLLISRFQAQPITKTQHLKLDQIPRENRVLFRVVNFLFRPITAQLAQLFAHALSAFSLKPLPFLCLWTDLHQIRNLSFFRRARFNRVVIFEFCLFVCLLSWTQLAETPAISLFMDRFA